MRITSWFRLHQLMCPFAVHSQYFVPGRKLKIDRPRKSLLLSFLVLGTNWQQMITYRRNGYIFSLFLPKLMTRFPHYHLRIYFLPLYCFAILFHLHVTLWNQFLGILFSLPCTFFFLFIYIIFFLTAGVHLFPHVITLSPFFFFSLSPCFSSVHVCLCVCECVPSAHFDSLYLAHISLTSCLYYLWALNSPL